MASSRYLKAFRDAQALGLPVRVCIRAGLTADSLPTRDAFSKKMVESIGKGMPLAKAIQEALKKGA